MATDKGDTPLANMSMEELMEEISKRYSLIPKEDVPQAQPRTKLEKLLQGMTPNKTADKLFNSGVHATSTPVATAQYNMPVNQPHATPVVAPAQYNMMDFLQQQPPQPSFSQPLTYHPSLPRIPNFSGDSPMPKGEVDYLVWRYEVQCLMNLQGLTCSQVLQIIRGSLRGSARMMIVPLGEQASVEHILTKLDALYSNAASKEELMTEFFNSVQRPEENVTSFACRLETLLQTIINKGNLPYLARNDLLRHKFWTGLHSDTLKMQTRHKYDSVLDYNILLRDIRQVDQELAHRSPSHQTTTSVKHHPVAVNDVQQQIATLTSQMESLQSKMTTMEHNFDSKLNKKFEMMFEKLDERLVPQHQPTMPPYQEYPQQQHDRSQERGRGNGNRGRGYRGGQYSNRPGQQHNNTYSHQGQQQQNSNYRQNGAPNNNIGRGRGNQNPSNF